MNVIILVAGVGSRLMPMTRNTPKSLLEVGHGYTLLERQLESIGACGLRDVTLVTGYRSEQIEAKIKIYSDFNIRIVFNPFYRLANNIASAWMGLQDQTGEAIIVNGDDLFKPNVMQGLLDADDDITMVISRKGEYDDDDMKVVTEGNRILDVGKDIPLERTNGESIGMMRFKGRGLGTMQECLLEMVRDEENLQLFYLAAMRKLMREEHRISFVECSDADWAEVDFHPDLVHMRERLLASLPEWE